MDVQKQTIDYITPVLLGLTVSGLILLLMTAKKAFAAVVPNQKFRACDSHGCGSFGASRGDRKHAGVDVVVTPGTKIVSPISGKVIRYPFPYAGDISYKGILIENEQYSVKIFYLNPTAIQNTIVKQGDAIGTAQNIAAKYSPGMTNHIHVEVRDRAGNLLNPEKLFT